MENIYDSPNVIEQDKLDIIQKMFFDNQPVSVEVDFEGQGINKDNNYQLGCKAGPRIHVSNLVHEMCHLAEREVDKLLKRPMNSWGYTFGKYWKLLGRSGYEAQTSASVHREKCVWAYQLSVEIELGIRDIEYRDDEDCTHAQSLAISAVYLDAFMFYKKEVLTESQLKDYNKAEKEAVVILAEEIKSLSKKEFTYARFCEEWFKRMELLKNQSRAEIATNFLKNCGAKLKKGKWYQDKVFLGDDPILAWEALKG